MNINCRLDIHLQHLLYFIDNQVNQDNKINNIKLEALNLEISDELLPCLNEKQVKKLVSFILVSSLTQLPRNSEIMNTISFALLEQLKLGKHLLDTFWVRENYCADFKWLPYIKHVTIELYGTSRFCNLLDKLGEIDATDISKGQVESVYIYHLTSTKTVFDETRILDLKEHLKFVPELYLKLIDMSNCITINLS